MTFSGPIITHIGAVKDAPKPQMGPVRGTPLIAEIRTASVPAGQFIEMEISQDAAADLVAKVTERLKARGLQSCP